MYSTRGRVRWDEVEMRCTGRSVLVIISIRIRQIFAGMPYVDTTWGYSQARARISRRGNRQNRVTGYVPVQERSKYVQVKCHTVHAMRSKYVQVDRPRINRNFLLGNNSQCDKSM